MSSSGALARTLAAAVALLLGWPAATMAQDRGDSASGAPASPTAEEALATAREIYRPPTEQTVSFCPPDSAENREDGDGGDVIIVCRRVLPEYKFQTRDGPTADLGHTADGVPRAPDVTTIPSCIPGQGLVCMRMGSVPPPVLMVDLTKFPEPLSPAVAALVSRVPTDQEPPPAPVTGRRVAIPIDGD